MHRLIEKQVTSLLAHCATELNRYQFGNVDEALNSDFLIQHSAELNEQKKELERFLHQRVYRHPQLIAMRDQAQNRVKQMFEAYCRNPEFFPEKYQPRAERIGVRRMAVEYIAGMTDHFCEETYRKMFP